MVPLLKCFAGSIFGVFIFLCWQELVKGFSSTNLSNNNAFTDEEDGCDVLGGFMAGRRVVVLVVMEVVLWR